MACDTSFKAMGKDDSSLRVTIVLHAFENEDVRIKINNTIIFDERANNFDPSNGVNFVKTMKIPIESKFYISAQNFDYEEVIHIGKDAKVIYVNKKSKPYVDVSDIDAVMLG